MAFFSAIGNAFKALGGGASKGASKAAHAGWGSDSTTTPNAKGWGSIARNLYEQNKPATPGGPPVSAPPVAAMGDGAAPPMDDGGGATTMDMVTLPDGTTGSRQQLRAYYQQHPEAAQKQPLSFTPPTTNQGWYSLPQYQPPAQGQVGMNPYWQSPQLSTSYSGGHPMSLAGMMGDQPLGSQSGYATGQ